MGDGVERITKEELLLKIEKREDVLIIDVRNPTAYSTSDRRIKGAVRAFGTELDGLGQGLSPGKEVVAYCT